ncbi:MAG: hypothetical protein RIS29_2508 [Bacteroidota bacterium]|jgi:hypothetical protein
MELDIKNINTVITENGSTSDIITVVMRAYDIEDDDQIKAIAENLEGANDFETCRNIWQYLIDHVRYHADSEGSEGEMIKTPARLLHDGVGDCKSYSLFTAVCLRWLEIPHVFRFASYSNRKEATHVYVVAFPSPQGEGAGGEVIIDAVAAVQLGYPFNKEKQYSYHCDMNNSGTKISYLAGFGSNKPIAPKRRRKNIGAISPDRFIVWTGDDNEAGITPGKSYMYSLLDYYIEMYNISTTVKDQLLYLDKLDVMASLLHAYNLVDGDTYDFADLAQIIAAMAFEGMFTSNELDPEKRYDRLDDLYTIIESHYNEGYKYKGLSQEIWNMVQTHVLPFNKVPSGVGRLGSATSESELISKIKEAGIYFVYHPEFLGSSSKPSIVAEKSDIQNRTFLWMDGMNEYQTTAGTMLTIRSGIVARTGMTPEDFIKAMKEGKVLDFEYDSIPGSGVSGIGEPITVTILAVIGIVTALVKLIQLIWPAKTKTKYSKPENIELGTFDPTTDYKTSTASIFSGNNVTTYGILGVGALVLYKLFKK